MTMGFKVLRPFANRNPKHKFDFAMVEEGLLLSMSGLQSFGYKTQGRDLRNLVSGKYIEVLDDAPFDELMNVFDVEKMIAQYNKAKRFPHPFKDAIARLDNELCRAKKKIYELEKRLKIK